MRRLGKKHLCNLSWYRADPRSRTVLAVGSDQRRMLSLPGCEINNANNSTAGIGPMIFFKGCSRLQSQNQTSDCWEFYRSRWVKGHICAIRNKLRKEEDLFATPTPHIQQDGSEVKTQSLKPVLASSLQSGARTAARDRKQLGSSNWWPIYTPRTILDWK